VREKKKSKLDQVLEKIGSLEKGQQALVTDVGSIKTILGNHGLQFLKQDRKLEEMDSKIGRKFDEVLIGQDKIVKVLEIARNDRKLAKKKDDEQDRETNGLKDRVKKIEDKVLV
jgi:hypothetical protein